jgi:hypothetical protein
MAPVRSDSDSDPVGDTVSMPRRRCVVPLRPSRFAIGVIEFVCEVEMEPVRLRTAERVAEKVGVWNVSFRRMR